MISESIGNIIKGKRTSLNITQQRLSDITGISVHAIINIETGKGNPTVEVLNNLCEALGLELVVRIKGAI
jgi:transcriptional regulator with XRE-family HTH domain